MMGPIRAGQRADADRVRGIDVVQEFVPSLGGSVGTTGTRTGVFHLQNGWVNVWARMVYGGTGIFFGSLRRFMYPPLPFDVPRMVPYQEGALTDATSSSTFPIGWGKLIDSSSSAPNRLVSVLPIFVPTTSSMIALRFDVELFGGFNDPFELAAGDVITITFAYPTSGYALAGVRE
jgi:hypothetical protein